MKLPDAATNALTNSVVPGANSVAAVTAAAQVRIIYDGLSFKIRDWFFVSYNFSIANSSNLLQQTLQL